MLRVNQRVVIWVTLLLRWLMSVFNDIRKSNKNHNWHHSLRQRYTLGSKHFWMSIGSHPVRNSLWKKKNRASDIEGKFHAILKCRIWIYHQKLFSSLDIRDSVHFGIYLEKWAIFWLFLISSVLATSGYTTHFPCVLGCNQMWPVLKISKIAKK